MVFKVLQCINFVIPAQAGIYVHALALMDSRQRGNELLLRSMFL